MSGYSYRSRLVGWVAQKAPMQFSKKQCIFADILVVAVWIGEIILRWNGKEGVSDVAIAIITAYGAFATGGYFTLTGVRDCSLNKHHIKLNETEEYTNDI